MPYRDIQGSMKIGVITRDSIKRRTCDNGRCADPAEWKTDLELGEDQGYKEVVSSNFKLTGPFVARINLCDFHQLEFVKQLRESK